MFFGNHFYKIHIETFIKESSNKEMNPNNYIYKRINDGPIATDEQVLRFCTILELLDPLPQGFGIADPIKSRMDDVLPPHFSPSLIHRVKQKILIDLPALEKRLLETLSPFEDFNEYEDYKEEEEKEFEERFKLEEKERRYQLFRERKLNELKKKKTK